MNATADSTATGSLDIALAYLHAGLSIVPIRPDGTKRPAVRSWESYQQKPPPENAVRHWWQEGKAGIGVIGGAVSGNLETIDFDRGELYPRWCELVEAQAPGLVSRLCVTQTPRQPSGYHVRYRCSAVEIPGNMKLAQEPGKDPETGKPCVVTLIETRGSGGYAIAPGSPPTCHPTGRTWDHIAGPPLTELPDITAEEREILITLARSFDVAVAARSKRPKSGTVTGAASDSLRPGDDFDRRGPSWSEILEPHGWQLVQSRGGADYWRRPGKDTPGISATTGFCKGSDGTDLLAVFSSNAHPFEGANGKPCSCYGRFAAHTLLNHDGDFKAAAKDLAAKGYGSKRRSRTTKNGPTTATSDADAEEQIIPDGRPKVTLTTDEALAGDKVTAILATDPLLFQLDGRVITPRVPEPTPPKLLKRGRLEWQWPEGLLALAPAIPAFARRRISEKVALWKWMTTRKGDQIIIEAHVPEWLVSQILSWPGSIRKLVGLAVGPTLRPDGSLLNSFGYDVESRLYLARPVEGLEPLIPDRPTLDDARMAEGVIRQLVQDFPFRTHGDYLRWLTMLVTAVIRHLLSQTPFGIITANMQGAGKTTLARLICIIAFGFDPILMSWPEEDKYAGDNENEIRKRLASLLHGGATFALIDNLPRGSVFSSPTLDAFVTSGAFYDRQLGRNDGAMAGGPNRCFLIVTGNNVVAGGDSKARSYECRLFTTNPNPRDRPASSFKVGEAEEYAKQNRPQLLAAILTICRAWIHADCPRPEGESWGSFHDWVDRAVAIVRWVSGKDPLASRTDPDVNGDPEEKALHSVVSLWWEVLGSTPLSAGQIIKKLEHEVLVGNQVAEVLRDNLFTLAPGKMGAGPTAPRLSHVLQSFQDRPLVVESKVLRLASEQDAHLKTTIFGVLQQDGPQGDIWNV